MLIAAKKRQLHAQFRKEAQNFSQELGQCDGISCIIKTIAHKAHGAWKIVYFRFQPNHTLKEMGRPEQTFAQAHTHVAQVTQATDDHLNATTTPPPYQALAVCHPREA